MVSVHCSTRGVSQRVHAVTPVVNCVVHTHTVTLGRVIQLEMRVTSYYIVDLMFKPASEAATLPLDVRVCWSPA